MMNKVIPVLFALLITFSVHGEERLAAVRLGTPCEEIRDIERRLGSVELSGDNATGISEYSGTHGGKKAKIVYRCATGVLAEQTIVVTAASRDEAYQFADTQKVELSMRLGDPLHDGLQLAAWRKMLFGFLGADLDYLTAVVVWGRANEDVMLSVTESATNLWQVSISQGSSKQEYILNS